MRGSPHATQRDAFERSGKIIIEKIRTLSQKLALGAIRQAGLTVGEFVEAYNKK
jgi:hypothetical protein